MTGALILTFNGSKALTFVVPTGLGTRDADLEIALNAVMTAAVATAIAVAFRMFQTLIEVPLVAG